MGKTFQTYAIILFSIFASIFIILICIVFFTWTGVIHIGEDYTPYVKWVSGALICGVGAFVLALGKKLLNPSFENPPDLDGDWEYECVRDDGKYKHGGIATITVKKAPFGWDFRITGKRTWTAEITFTGALKKIVVIPHAHWDNTWGTFSGNDELRYEYSVKIEGNSVQGYGSGTFEKDRRGTIRKIEGNFYQLPPHEPFHGTQTYTRVTDSPSPMGRLGRTKRRAVVASE